MSSHPQFNLHTTRAARASAHIAARDPFKLERRREERHGAEGVVLATYSNGDGHFGVTHLEMIDRSARGMGVRTAVPIQPGSTVNICPEGSTVPWLGSRVVRCEAGDGDFVLGLKYAGAAAAA